MTLSVRVHQRVEQKLAEYCVEHDTTRSAVVQQLLEAFLEQQARTGAPSMPSYVGKDEGSGADVSGAIKEALRGRFRQA